jgi:hypothetical protein
MRMRKNKYATLGFVSAILLVATTAGAFAQPPMSVHRSGDASLVRNALPLAIVSTSPFDDTPGLLSDGQLHFYVATDDGAQPVWISLHKNTGLDTVRISFDDEDPWSAPIDPSLSSVELSATTIPADGYTVVYVTVVPRDATGVELGRGLDVRADGSALWPGSVVGSVTDEGDGSYTVQILSATPGQGEVWITVEGVALDDTPTLVYEGVGGPYDLREMAKVQIDALTEAGGAFDQLVDGLDPDDAQVEMVAEALETALDALGELNLDDYERDDGALGDALAAAVGSLEDALDEAGPVDPTAIQNLIDDLVEAARMVAVFHMNAAESSCGACTTGDKLCDAEAALEKGDDQRDSSTPDYAKTVDWYAKATDKARDALANCS